jgi:hypothetical protein
MLWLVLCSSTVAQTDSEKKSADWPPALSADAKAKPPGLLGAVGTKDKPRRVQTLDIAEKGVFENYLVDHEFGSRAEIVRIKANGAVLRNCEIRNGTRDGVGVHAADVLIESCKIHHFLNGTYKEQKDAHGITGSPTRLIIRNCEIFYCSGDSVQFDPARRPWTDVLIENCEFWTNPLPADAAGFRKGERPGENAVDTKQQSKNTRSRIVIRNCVFHGFGQGQIDNMAALNLKNHIEARVENCVFFDNEICLRLRGGSDKYGGAHVVVESCSFYKSDFAMRLEDKIENLKIRNPAYGEGLKSKIQKAGGGAGPGFELIGERDAPQLKK